MASDVTALQVDVPGGGYPVLLGDGLLTRMPSLLGEHGLAARTAVFGC